MTLVCPSWLITSTDVEPRADWGVRVIGGQIERVANNRDLRAEFPDDDVVVADDHVVLPGFVNAHTHLYGTLAHGIPVDNISQDWRELLCGTAFSLFASGI